MDVYTFSLIVHVGMVSNLISPIFGFRIEECTKNTTTVVESGMNLSYTYMSDNGYYDSFFFSRIIYFDGQHYNDPCFCFFDSNYCNCYKSTYSVVPRNMNGTFAIDFSIHHAELSDSRIYFSYWSCCSYIQQCLFLHVIERVVYSDSIEGYIEEGDGVLFNVTKPNVTYTSISRWLVGEETLLRWPYVVKGDSLKIAKVTRQLNEQNITYVVTEHNQTVSKTFQIKVAYGPDRLLIFSPDRSFYHVDVGDNIGPITCHTECNPACDITWETFGKTVMVVGTELVIGDVRTSYGGEYRCTAKRNGTDVMSMKSIYLVVNAQVDSTVLILLAVGFGVCFLGLITVTVLIIIQGQWLISLQICNRKDDSVGGDASTNDTGTSSSMIYSDLQRNDQDDDKDNYGQINIGHEEQAYMNVSNHI